MSDRVKNGLQKVIQCFLRPTDYHALYPAKVVSQNAAGNLDVTPDDARLPGMQDVPVRYGIPCVSATIREGSRVLIGFENGNPKHPIATVWDTASVEYIIVAPDKVYLGGNGGDAQPIARLGDAVECLMPPVVPVVGTLSGAPFSGVLTIVDPIVGIISSSGSKGYSE